MTLKNRIHEIIFGADTPAGKFFDVALIILILASVIAVVLESVESYKHAYYYYFKIVEWGLTIIFTIEYFLRIYCTKNSKSYIFSFFGIVDLLAILPSYLSLVFVGTHYLAVVRILRIMRVFRILKFVQYVQESSLLFSAIQRSFKKIVVFLVFILSDTVILGSLMYLIEGPKNGFTSIPKGVYWAIVTLTTVGFGDISPQTPFGQFIAGSVMIMGYGVLAVPTGLVSVELSQSMKTVNNVSCHNCSTEGHHHEAEFCFKCGHKVYPDEEFDDF